MFPKNPDQIRTDARLLSYKIFGLLDVIYEDKRQADRVLVLNIYS